MSFHLAGSFGDDVILDFRDGEDQIMFKDSSVGDLDD